MDIISITKLRSNCIIGINDCERSVKQEILIDIELFGYFKNQNNKDSIESTINYETLSNAVSSYVKNSNHYLIETLAEKISDICLTYKLVKKVKIVVSKPNALSKASNVSITIERSHEAVES